MKTLVVYFSAESGRTAAASVAAVTDYPERVGGRNVALIMSGGNIDAGLLMRILNEPVF